MKNDGFYDKDDGKPSGYRLTEQEIRRLKRDNLLSILSKIPLRYLRAEIKRRGRPRILPDHTCIQCERKSYIKEDGYVSPFCKRCLDL